MARYVTLAALLVSITLFSSQDASAFGRRRARRSQGGTQYVAAPARPTVNTVQVTNVVTAPQAPTAAGVPQVAVGQAAPGYPVAAAPAPVVPAYTPAYAPPGYVLVPYSAVSGLTGFTPAPSTPAGSYYLVYPASGGANLQAASPPPAAPMLAIQR